MKKVFVGVVCLIVVMTSATIVRTLQSTTYIPPGECFILGANQHNAFRVNLTNASVVNVFVYSQLASGERLLEKEVAPQEKIELRAAQNTSIVIDNPSEERATVKLKVKGDVGLSMEYSTPSKQP